MELASNGAFIERKAEEIRERALETVEGAIADLVNKMKALRRANDGLSDTMATAVSTTAQLQSSFTKISSSVTAISQSLHRIEHNTNRSVAFSPSVLSSAITSHLPVPIAQHLHFSQPANTQPAIPSLTSSIPPQLTLSASIATEQIRYSSTTYVDRIPSPTVQTSGSSTSSSITASTPDNYFQTAITSFASIRATLQRTFTEISPSLSRVEKQSVEPSWLPYLASFFSPSTETPDSQIAKLHTATTLPNFLTPHSFIPERLVENLNPIDLDSEGECGQILIPLMEADSNEDESPTEPFSETVLQPLPVLGDKQLLPSAVGISITQRLRETANSMGFQSNLEVLLDVMILMPLRVITKKDEQEVEIEYTDRRLAPLMIIHGQLVVMPQSQCRFLAPLMHICFLLSPKLLTGLVIIIPFHFKNERIRSGTGIHGPHLDVIQTLLPLLVICHTAKREGDEEIREVFYEVELSEEAVSVIVAKERHLDLEEQTNESLICCIVARWQLAFVAEHHLLHCWSCQYVTGVCILDMEVYEVMKFSQVKRQCSLSLVALSRRTGASEKFPFSQPFGNANCLNTDEKLQESTEIDDFQGALCPNKELLLKSLKPPASRLAKHLRDLYGALDCH